MYSSCCSYIGQQNESLQAAMTALADYKLKQRGSYLFDIPAPTTDQLVISDTHFSYFT